MPETRGRTRGHAVRGSHRRVVLRGTDMVVCGCASCSSTRAETSSGRRSRSTAAGRSTCPSRTRSGARHIRTRRTTRPRLSAPAPALPPASAKIPHGLPRRAPPHRLRPRRDRSATALSFGEHRRASAATLDWPGMNLLQMMALDPNLARVLGSTGTTCRPRPMPSSTTASSRTTATRRSRADGALRRAGVRAALRPRLDHGGLTSLAQPDRGRHDHVGGVLPHQPSLRP